MGRNWGKRNRENTPISIWAYTSPTPFPHSPALKLFPIIGQIIKAHSHLGNSRELQGEGGVTHNTPNWVRLNFIPLCHLFLWWNKDEPGVPLLHQNERSQGPCWSADRAEEHPQPQRETPHWWTTTWFQVEEKEALQKKLYKMRAKKFGPGQWMSLSRHEVLNSIKILILGKVECAHLTVSSFEPQRLTSINSVCPWWVGKGMWVQSWGTVHYLKIA